MIVAADTNVLLRAILDDDPVQSPLARARLLSATQVFISAVVLCELASVFKQRRWDRERIAAAIRTLTSASNVRVDTLVVNSGLSFLERGGGFADGVILQTARAAGCETLLTFDQHLAQLGAPDVERLS